MKAPVLLVLGYFGFRTNQLDGQTVKTRSLLTLISEKTGTCDYFDTQDLRFSRISIFKMLISVVRANCILYLPAHNNLRFFFPILWLITRLFGIRLYYVVVGGWLPQFLAQRPLHRKLLRRIDYIFCETEAMRQALLHEFGFRNVGWLPNFRIHSYTPYYNCRTGELRVVFFSRINRRKGIDFVFQYASHVEREKLPVIIDFYGPIASGDARYFEDNLERYKCVAYRGELQPSSAYSVLNGYDVLVLPTKYETEGFPGAVLDAYISGIPVVVSSWIHASEFVEHEKTGLIFRFGDVGHFVSQMNRLVFDNALLEKLKIHALEKTKEYSSHSVWMRLCERFNSDGITLDL